ncbi:toprim domain-containing protein [Mycoplasmopsis caviae]|uniref:Recombination protein RecR n=1 Tax=Mycoplasmopsis caviae TaxID=55603 RepID=A0A3P8K8W4_9BACT|nr:toprim domain-containing protein [Mycoplasmopsis caviae]UUD35394.1 toprim domain-containing protein [Mycoplasmopsis caviae]VDR41829.1 recombinational DNA repair protein [Mycoplasmopsis caviae]
MKIETIEKLNQVLNTIPGISKKQADKMSNFFLNQDQEYIDNLVKNIYDLKNNITYCSICNFIKENNKCLVCDDKSRYNFLMIVENVATLRKIDDMDFYSGYYYILPYLLSLKGNKEIKNYDYTELMNYIQRKKFEEVIIVLSPSLEGEMTTSHLLKLISSQFKVKVSRAAIGMPMGSNLEYLDTFTIKQSIENRNK